MNNIILAKVTYHQLSQTQKERVNRTAERLIRRSPMYGSSVNSVTVEADKWRLYSIALAEERIPPLLDNSLAWSPSQSIRKDVESAHSIYKFEDRLRNNEYSRKHLKLMRR